MDSLLDSHLQAAWVRSRHELDLLREDVDGRPEVRTVDVKAMTAPRYPSQHV